MANTKNPSPANLKSTPDARGRRLKSLRMMVDLSRKEMAERHSISTSTLQSWEDGKAGGLTAKGAQRIVEAFRHEGILCRVEWLLHGIGLGPQVAEQIYSKASEPYSAYDLTAPGNDETPAIQELLRFREVNQDAIDIIIVDDGMEPHYRRGDFVGGRRHYHDSIVSCIGQDCILETTLGEVCVRRLRAGRQPGVYTLTCTNLATSIHDITLYDRQLLSAAPIIWHRRKDG